MKILCISNYYPPFFEGGYEISVKESMDYLINKGYEVYILCGNKGTEYNSSNNAKLFLPEEPKRILHYIDYSNPSFFDKHNVEKHNYHATINALSAIQPHLVYFGNQKAISIAPVLAVQKLKFPRVFDIGDIWPDSYIKSDLKSRMYRFLKMILPGTIGGHIHLDPIIVVSYWMRREMAQRYKSKRIYQIPRGIDLPPENTRVLKKPLRFIFAGRIEPNKGLDLCIQATSRVLAEYQDFCIDVYGEEDPIYANKCKDQINKFHLQQQIRFLGKTQNIHNVLPQYDVLLMPTMAKEAFGRIIIEAMAHSLIVIATDAYGPKEILLSKQNGILFKRGSAAALATAILELLQMKLSQLEIIRKQARLTVAQNYEINLVKKKLVYILESIVNDPNTLKEENHGTS